MCGPAQLVQIIGAVAQAAAVGAFRLQQPAGLASYQAHAWTPKRTSSMPRVDHRALPRIDSLRRHSKSHARPRGSYPARQQRVQASIQSPKVRSHQMRFAAFSRVSARGVTAR